MKKITLTAFLLMSASGMSNAANINELFDVKEKNFMCGGYKTPKQSPIFGHVQRSGDNYVMADLNAKINSIPMIKPATKGYSNQIHAKAKEDRAFTKKSIGQFNQLGNGHYQKRGETGRQLYKSTSSGLNDAYKIIETESNKEIYNRLSQDKYVKPINKQRKIVYSGVDLLNMCNSYWNSQGYFSRY